METNKFFTMLQLCDSAFPTGGFAHSMGSEAAVTNSYVRHKDDLKLFIVGSLENLGSQIIPFVKHAQENYMCADKLIFLDAHLDTMLSNHVAKRASLQQGETLLNASIEAFQIPVLTEIQELLESGQARGHQAIVFGVVCACLQIPLQRTLHMFMFIGLRTIIASLIRLGKIGAMEAQQYQFQLQENLQDIITRNWNIQPETAHLRFPILDIMQMSHDTMFCKLFTS